ncbi:hypothetical protein M406DRAFT_104550 [Cryphonectria parasitica EP155]|uniref:Uncharacterized protein n=1 Tax=Cryphonectria parasitica (strain ATCC 38755 / EP155) TaxID=660469 RepID=A0A9P4XPT8_CRYP1|nr:uncharacterized protein M406DRAFT_104550 [Cryphonectria parasitica EP155]KAF3759939.1 hypothetical protein M406DRAFT_104550 [Cryphonectria parasitica EP155]
MVDKRYVRAHRRWLSARTKPSSPPPPPTFLPINDYIWIDHPVTEVCSLTTREHDSHRGGPRVRSRDHLQKDWISGALSMQALQVDSTQPNQSSPPNPPANKPRQGREKSLFATQAPPSVYPSIPPPSIERAWSY